MGDQRVPRVHGHFVPTKHASQEATGSKEQARDPARRRRSVERDDIGYPPSATTAGQVDGRYIVQAHLPQELVRSELEGSGIRLVRPVPDTIATCGLELVGTENLEEVR